MNCLSCGEETKNPKFCSRSCSSSYNNKMIGARHGDPTLSICICGKKKQPDAALCQECYMSKIYTEACLKPISSLITEDQHPQYKHNKIRKWARVLLKWWKIPKVCKCGYNTHVEVCHIKPINSFSDDTLMGVVNSKDNLVYLCPNCHWELDNLK